ncbi:MAG: dihydrolipoyllysine-residue succinyltransferase [Desulfuromonadales bacterium]|nr:dihydrolipoyllysine-residue succinyltransferase [Desulfuromonadales bacterium]
MEIKVPEVGESVFEATVGKWHKRGGEAVQKGDLLCELETDKITLELNAEVAGTLSIQVNEGETVKIGSIIGRIEEGGEAKTEPPTPVAEMQQKQESTPPRREKPEPRRPPEPPRPPEAEPVPRAPLPVSPPSGEAAGGRPVSRQRMSPIRRRIAERLVQARQQTAMLTTFNEADLSRVQELRRQHRESFRKKHGVDLGLMSFFVKACVEALKEYPEVNARIEGEEIVYHHYYDVGIAVGAEKGLVVPVLRDAETLNFAEIEQKIAELVQKIQENKLGLADLEGGTFTITNGGVYGSLLSTPILNPPQSAVLGMHAIQERPVVREGAIAIRPMMYLALSYDHRLVDGRQAVGFLKLVKTYVEQPEEMLLEL